MANTYTQLYIHLVFAVKYRMGLITDKWKQQLYEYIVALAKNRKHRIYAINGMSDHIHILVSMSPAQSLSDFVQEIKRASSMWINDNRFVPGKFEWQEGYGAFSYGQSQIGVVVNYIKNQEEHHKKHTFKDEYKAFLKAFNISFDEHYIFNDPID